MITVITCVYCGQVYPGGTPTHSANILTEHIKVCKRHPLRFARETIKKLREVLIELVDVSKVEELVQMKAALSKTVSKEELPVLLKAVQVLLDTEEE